MPNLFEKFVKNFYDRKQNELKVHAIRLEWNAQGSSENPAQKGVSPWIVDEENNQQP